VGLGERIVEREGEGAEADGEKKAVLLWRAAGGATTNNGW
jgi:hypothetical protein